MVVKRCIAPPYSVILVSELGKGAVPSSMDGSVIAATASCIAIGCRSEVEGVTEMTVGSISEIGLTTPPAFSGVLATPGKIVALQTVFNEPIMEMAVQSDRTPIKIWVNDSHEPDKIFVGLGM